MLKNRVSPSTIVEIITRIEGVYFNIKLKDATTIQIAPKVISAACVIVCIISNFPTPAKTSNSTAASIEILNKKIPHNKRLCIV